MANQTTKSLLNVDIIVDILDTSNNTLPSARSITIDGVKVVKGSVVLFTALSDNKLNNKLYEAVLNLGILSFVPHKGSNKPDGAMTVGSVLRVRQGSSDVDLLILDAATGWTEVSIPSNDSDVNGIIDAQKGQPNGIASLDGSGKVPTAQLPATGGAPVDSVNTKTGVVVLDPDDLDDSATTNKFTTAGDISKLSGIESNATADQTGAEIKSAYEGEADTNAFTDAEKTKLSGVEAGAEVNDVDSVNTQTGAVVLDADDISDAATTNKFTNASDISKLAGIESSATADQTGAEIKSAYEGEADTNAFTDAEQTKLSGVEAGAEVNPSDSEIKTAYENNADTNAFTDAEQTKLSGIEAGAEVNDVASVNSLTGVVVLDPDDLSDAATTNKFVTEAQRNEITPERIFKVGPGLTYTTIQAGIDAADTFLSGAGTNDNPAIVEIYPKGSDYVEDLTLKSGVMLKAIGTNSQYENLVVLIGSATFAPTVSGSRVHILNLRIEPASGQSGVIFDSSSASSGNTRLVMENCTIRKDDADAFVLLDHLGGAGRVRLRNTYMERRGDGIMIRTAATTNGRIDVIGEDSTIFGNSFGTGATNMPVLEARGGRITFAGNRLIESATTSGNAMFQIPQNSPAIRFEDCHKIIQDGAGDILSLDAGNSNIRFEQAIVSFAGNGQFATGTNGTIEQKGLMIEEGANDLNRHCDPAITIREFADGLARGSDSGSPFDSSNFYVGRRGYATIQAAVDAVEAAGFIGDGSSRAVVHIGKGTYTENVAIAGHMTLIGEPDSIGDANAVTIQGTITITPTGSVSNKTDNEVQLENITVNPAEGALDQSALIITGSDKYKFTARRCSFFNNGSSNVVRVINTATIDDNENYFYNCFMGAGDSAPITILEVASNKQVVLYGDPQGLDIFNSLAFFADENLADITFLDMASSSQVRIKEAQIKITARSATNSLMKIADSCALTINNSYLNLTTNVGTMFSMSGAGSNIECLSSALQLNSPFFDKPAFVKSGSAALGTIEITDNSFDAGDKITFAKKAWATVEVIDNSFDAGDAITVDGSTFTLGSEWSAGGSAAASATNLAAAIDAGAAGFSSFAVGAKVYVVFDTAGTAGNGKAVTETDGATDNFVVSGSTAGGLDAKDFEEGVEWSAGGDTEESARNLRDAINSLGTGATFGGQVVAGIDPANASRVVIASRKWVQEGNFITMSETDGATDNFTLSGSELSGGVTQDFTGFISTLQFDAGTGFSGNPGFQDTVTKDKLSDDLTSF